MERYNTAPSSCLQAWSPDNGEPEKHNRKGFLPVAVLVIFTHGASYAWSVGGQDLSKRQCGPRPRKASGPSSASTPREVTGLPFCGPMYPVPASSGRLWLWLSGPGRLARLSLMFCSLLNSCSS